MKPHVFLLSVWFALASSCLAAAAQSETSVGEKILTAARSQIGVTLAYDPAYVSLKYPGGDVPLKTGVCSDVVIRALRHVGLDLQREVHEDMSAHFLLYPQKWGLKRPDRNIDHRRVPNLMTYLSRKHVHLGEKLRIAGTYAPGDIVAWDLGNGQLHIGIVSDKKIRDVPLIIHNIGAGAQEEDLLFKYRVIGHYRLRER